MSSDARSKGHVVEVVPQSSSGIVFLDTPGGTGRPFVLNLILPKIRLSGIAIVVSSYRIAATLLQGGRTAHSTFKLPQSFRYDEFPVSNILKSLGLAHQLKQCHLIV